MKPPTEPPVKNKGGRPRNPPPPTKHSLEDTTNQAARLIQEQMTSVADSLRRLDKEQSGKVLVDPALLGSRLELVRQLADITKILVGVQTTMSRLEDGGEASTGVVGGGDGTGEEIYNMLMKSEKKGKK